MFIKKIIVTCAVIGTFIVYSIGIRHQTPVVGRPLSFSQQKATTTSTSPSNMSSGSAPPTNSSGTSSTSSKLYKDGTYIGSIADAYYGNVQVSVTISGGKLTDVKFIQYPNTHSTSVMINQQAMPYLQQEAIQVQSANVQIVSGATFTSQAFQQSLQAALSQA